VIQEETASTCDGGHPESEPHQHGQQGQHGGAGEHGHGHGVTADSDARLITIALALISGFLVFEVVMAFAGHSLALLHAAGHQRPGRLRGDQPPDPPAAGDRRHRGDRRRDRRGRQHGRHLGPGKGQPRLD
jgi:hypothetical protein